MNSEINAEILTIMAEKIEDYGAKFYQQASSVVKKPEVSLEIEKLSEMEIEHGKIFSEIKSQYLKFNKGSILQGQDYTIEKYLKTIQDNRIFDLDSGIRRTISGDETIEDIVNIAISLEKDSIVFYSGFANFISDRSFHDMLNQVIREEISHLSVLTNLPIY